MLTDSFVVLKELLSDTAFLSGNQFFQTATRILSRLFEADFVFIAHLKDAGSAEMEVLGSWRGGKALGSWSFQLPGTPCSLLYEGQDKAWNSLRVGGSVCVSDALRCRFDSMRDTNYERFIGVPMKDARQQLIGHIALFFEKPWTSERERDHVVELVELFSYKVQSELTRYVVEKERLETLKQLEAVNQRLEREAVTDPLTHLYNRRYFSRRMQEAFSKFTRNTFPYSLLLLDIDHFKSVNDEFGHDVGDNALRQVATILFENCRKNVELLFRVGGEEFAILVEGELLPSTLQGFGERINHMFRTTPLNELSGRALTVSIGGAFPVQGDASWNALYRRADAALYEAKHAGRDRTFVDGRR